MCATLARFAACTTSTAIFARIPTLNSIVADLFKFSVTYHRYTSQEMETRVTICPSLGLTFGKEIQPSDWTKCSTVIRCVNLVFQEKGMIAYRIYLVPPFIHVRYIRHRLIPSLSLPASV